MHALGIVHSSSLDVGVMSPQAAYKSGVEVVEVTRMVEGYPHGIYSIFGSYDVLAHMIQHLLTSAKVEFGLIPKQNWYQPDWIGENKAPRESGEDGRE